MLDVEHICPTAMMVSPPMLMDLALKCLSKQIEGFRAAGIAAL